MADAKISALAALAGADVDTAADVLGIIDTSVTTSKKILVDELRIALGIATQAQQETGTSLVTTVTPGRQQFHQSACKGWAYVQNNGAVSLLASYNVSGVVLDATGLVTVSWTTDFSSAAYACVGTVVLAGGIITVVTATIAAGSIQINTRNSISTDTNANFHIMAFGDQ